MKKIINKLKKNSLFTFILGILLCSGIVYGASYLATDVSYTPADDTWEVSNVNEALDSLYDKHNKKFEWTHYEMTEQKGTGQYILNTKDAEVVILNILNIDARYNVVRVNSITGWKNNHGSSFPVYDSVSNSNNNLANAADLSEPITLVTTDIEQDIIIDIYAPSNAFKYEYWVLK